MLVSLFFARPAYFFYSNYNVASFLILSTSYSVQYKHKILPKRLSNTESHVVFEYDILENKISILIHNIV
jgi:hypothetical protein